MQPSELSSSVVRFISKLLPLYVEEYHGRVVCARSLHDGTLVMPVAEDPDNENGMVRVIWRGDEASANVIRGIFLAQLAIGEYVRFHSLAKPEKAASDLNHLAQHFEVKTGQPLGLEESDAVIDTLGSVSRLIEKLGPAAALQAIKRLLVA